MRWAEGGGGLREGGLAGVGPLEGAGHRGVEVGQKVAQLCFQVGPGGEVAATQEFSHHDAEHDFNLVQPRTVFR